MSSYTWTLFSFFLALAACKKPESKKHIDTSTKSTVEILQESFESILSNAQAEGCILLYNPSQNMYYSNDYECCRRGTLPASTFKIPNSMILLESGIVENLNEIIPWDGKPRAFKSWEKDLSFKESYQKSCLPCYQKLTRKLGHQKMKDYVGKLDYPGMEISESTFDEFWINGNSKINLIQQIDFLRKIANRELPISAQTQEQLLEMMQIDSLNEYPIFGKTGWAFSENKNDNIGWFVGWIQLPQEKWFFATRIEPKDQMPLNKFPQARVAISKMALTEMMGNH